MDSYKVEVNNEAESREVQELFFELGFGWHCGDIKDLKNLDMAYLYTYDKSKDITCGSNESYFINHENKELTIQKLKDMVVLKRNDVGDATHESNGYKFYISKHSALEYIGGWKDAKEYINDVNIKPIEKKEMKEFLVNHDNKWTLQLLDSDTEENSFRVAVPSGAEIYVYFSGDKKSYFYNPSNEIFENHWVDASCKAWSFNQIKKGIAGEILWQRSEAEYLMQGGKLSKNMRTTLGFSFNPVDYESQDTVKVTIDELKHRVYKKDVSHLDSIDVYRVLELFNVQSHAVGHAIKKLLCSGGRGAKDEAQDIQEAIDSLIRYQEMKNEDA